MSEEQSKGTILKEYSDTLALQSGIRRFDSSLTSPSLGKKKIEPIHERPLAEQQKSLFLAFISNDRNYIYEFDEDVDKKRGVFGKKAFDLSLQAVIYYGLGNLLYHNFLGKPKRIPFQYRVPCFALMNILPAFYFYYQTNLLHAQVNEYLFEKFLKN